MHKVPCRLPPVIAMKRHPYKLFSFLAALAVFVAGAPSFAAKQRVPRWADGALEADFPRDSYIAAVGYGVSAQAAAAAASAEIGRYFSQSVETSVQAEQVAVSVSGMTTDERRIRRQTVITSSVELFAVRHTEPWHERESGQYAVCAYIDRAEAWQAFEPKLKEAAQRFSALHGEGRRQADSFRALLAYGAAKACAERDGLSDLILFAHVLFPSGARQYQAAQDLLASVPADMRRLADGCSVAIECANDCGGVVASAVAASFGRLGIAVSDGSGESVYVCTVDVAENRQELPAGTFYTPSVRITVLSKGAAVHTYSRTAVKTGARNADVARQRAYGTLSQEIGRSFLQER